MGKYSRHGQSAIISEGDRVKIRACLSAQYRLLFDIAWFTGERWGALVQLRTSDVYDRELPRSTITFRAATRKATPSGKRSTRQVPVHSELASILAATPPPQTEYLFECPARAAYPEKAITLRAADAAFRAALIKAGCATKGYSTHSTRRTFITRLYQRGIDVLTIQRLTGHQDLRSLIRYIDLDPEQAARAIELL